MNLSFSDPTVFIHTDFLVKRENVQEQLPLDPSIKLVILQCGDAYYPLPREVFQAARERNLPLEGLCTQPAAVIKRDTIWTAIGKPVNDAPYLLVDDGSELIGYICINELFVQLKEAHRQLMAYFDAVLETTDSTICLINQETKTLVWTKGAERLYSIKQKDILGEKMTRFFPENRLDILRILHTGEQYYHKQHQPRDDLLVLINSNPVRLDGKVIGAVSCEQDVTHQAQLTRQLNHAEEKIEHLQKRVSQMDQSLNPFHWIKGSSRAIQRTIDKVKQIGNANVRVLLLGESGVGKELFARAIHEMRFGSEAPFIPINCGAIPAALFESELFGYEKGAFSGAAPQGGKGKFDLAAGGTLFLDEVGELSVELQVKLLRVLQEGSYYSVGGTRLKTADCAIVAATNRDLKARVQAGDFREDLYYRLNTISITIPPLRERVDDIIELSHDFLFEFSEKYRRPCTRIPKEIMMALVAYRWPGNIRELRNAIERLVIFSSDGTLNQEDLPVTVRSADQLKGTRNLLETDSETAFTVPTLEQAMRDCQKKTICQALDYANANKNQAAAILGVSRTTLYNKMHQLGLS